MNTSTRRIDWYLVLGLGAIVFLLANNLLAFSVARTMRGEIDPFSSVEVTLLTTPDCPDCFDLAPLREYLEQNGVATDQIKEVAYDSKAGQKLVKAHEISSVPTAIIPGAITDLEFMSGVVENLGKIKNGAFVITELQPPFIDVATGDVFGRFEMTVLSDATCTECYDPALHDQVLARLAMKPYATTTIDIGSEEGKALVESYVITSVPTILLRGDLDRYSTLQDVWTSVGTIENDGTYVLRQGVANMGTYKRLSDGMVIEPTQPTN